MVTDPQLYAIAESERETFYRSMYQLFLYSDKGGTVERLAYDTLARCRMAWGWSEEFAATLEQRMNRFIAERSRQLTATGHLSLGIEVPSMH